MTTEWIKRNINPELLKRYEQALNELRGRTANLDTVVKGIQQSQSKLDEIEQANSRHNKP